MQKQSNTAIETATGNFVDVINPEPNTLSIYDIAHALSRQCRFIGHCTGEPYSVTEHSMLVLALVRCTLLAVRGGVTDSEITQSLIKWVHFIPDENVLVRIDIICLNALLHDSTEAYLVDVPSPIKKHSVLKVPYAELEANLDRAINCALGVPEITEQEKAIIKWADLLALKIEAYHMMPSKGESWCIEFPDFSPSFGYLLVCDKNWRISYNRFLDEFNFLKSTI